MVVVVFSVSWDKARNLSFGRSVTVAHTQRDDCANDPQISKGNWNVDE
jgi:hypothetical protein